MLLGGASPNFAPTKQRGFPGLSAGIRPSGLVTDMLEEIVRRDKPALSQQENKPECFSVRQSCSDKNVVTVATKM